MKPSRIYKSIAAALLVGSTAAVANPGAAQILYKTGFEAPEFVAGQPLAGQQGWFAPPPLSPNAAVISTDNPRQGKQSVLVQGGDLEHQDFIKEATGGYYDAIGSYRKPVCPDDAQPGCTAVEGADNPYGYDAKGKVIRVSAHVRVDGRYTPGSNFFSASISPIGLGTEDWGGVGELAISSDGHVYGYTGTDLVPELQVKDRVTLGEWHTLAVEADFAARKSAFFVDDECVGVISFDPQVFDPQVSTDALLRGSMLVYAAPDSTTGERKLYEKKDYSAQFDQFAIMVKRWSDWHDCHDRDDRDHRHDRHDGHDGHDRHDRHDRHNRWD